MCASLWEQYPSKTPFSLPCFVSAQAHQAAVNPSITEETVSSTHVCCSTALHSPSSSTRALLCHEVAEHCHVSPLPLYKKAIHVDSVAPLCLDLLSFPFRTLFRDSQKLVFSFFSLIHPQKGRVCKLLDANSLQARHISDILTFLHLSYLGHLQKKMGRWMGASMAQRNGMISHTCMLSQQPM